jgi:hypothetical protein
MPQKGQLTEELDFHLTLLELHLPQNSLEVGPVQSCEIAVTNAMDRSSTRCVFQKSKLSKCAPRSQLGDLDEPFRFLVHVEGVEPLKIFCGELHVDLGVKDEDSVRPLLKFAPPLGSQSFGRRS